MPTKNGVTKQIENSMSNKARNSKESILTDTKELLKILDTAIKRMPKMYRQHGAAIRMEQAGYDIIHHFTIAYNCKEVRIDEIRMMFGAYGRLIAAFEILMAVRLDTQKSSNHENSGKMGLFTDTCKLAIARQIERIEEGVVKWHNAIKVSASRLPVGQHEPEDGRQYV